MTPLLSAILIVGGYILLVLAVRWLIKTTAVKKKAKR